MQDIRKEIIASNISITELSRQSGISRQTIYSIINQDVYPKISTVKALCDVLGVNYRNYIPY